LCLEAKLALLETFQHLSVAQSDIVLELKTETLTAEVVLQEDCFCSEELVLGFGEGHSPKGDDLCCRLVLALLALVLGLGHFRKHLVSAFNQAIDKLGAFNILFEA